MDKIKNNWYFYFVAILLLILVGYAIWSTQTQKAQAPTTEEEVMEAVVEEEDEVIEEELLVDEDATEAAEATEGAELITPAELDETSLIMDAVLERVGLNEEDVVFTVTINTGTHAKGNIRDVGAVGGGYWLAVKSGGKWVAVYDGQANPPCEDVDLYNFPSDMVPECMDDNNQLVTR